jgi:hypothetical protein
MVNTGTAVITDNQDQSRLVTFAGLTGNTGTSQTYAPGVGGNFALIVQGTFSSATVILQGSNDGGITFFPIKDLFNAAISITAGALVVLGNLPLLIQLSWSGGAGAVALTALLSHTKPYL